MRLSAIAVCLLVACVEIYPDAPYCGDEGDETPLVEKPLFHRDVRPILRKRCARCHKEDGIAGFSIDEYSEAVRGATRIGERIAAREMPPWKPASCCNEYKHDGALRAEERATILEWISTGTPEGDYVKPDEIEQPGLSRVDLELSMKEAYTPAPPRGTTDDTRCFIIDWPLDERTAVTGMELLPGAPGEVHHALVLVASAEQARDLQKLDDQDEGPGWSCPGGLVSDFKDYLGGWSPGFEGADYPEGLGTPIEPGSVLILGMHYSLHEAPEPDLSSIRVRIDDKEVRKRKALSVFNPTWLVGGMPIPKGDPDVVHSYSYDPTLLNGGNAYDLHAVNIHMHERGKRGLVSILRKDGTTDCLIQIDDWDYAYQGDFLFKEPIRLNKGDRLYIECRWDNTADNQRVIDGELQKPVDLAWDEDEEMCVAFVTASRAP